jgi:acetate kinase
MRILVLNAGSSSLKCELYAAGRNVDEDWIWQAEADWKDLPGPASVRIRRTNDPGIASTVRIESLEAIAEHLLRSLVSKDAPALQSFQEIDIVGHRVVHGGERYRQPTPLTAEVRTGIRELAPFAPLHNPLALAVIEAADRILTQNTVQIAVFDTAFHATLPPQSYLYPGPADWAKRGLRRYGFHGISHQYVGAKTAEVLKKDPGELRIVTCHLGNGCSLCAIGGGKSLETTMGFTPLEGLMMGSRSGTVDPGLVIYLLKQEGASAESIDHLLNHNSGLKGLSSISSDLRQVQAAADGGNRQAEQALQVYSYRLAYFISALIPALGGLDALAFAGGVGENSWLIRERVCRQLNFLHVVLDGGRNRQPRGDCVISSEDSQVSVLRVQTRENLQIARECLRLKAPAKH